MNTMAKKTGSTVQPSIGKKSGPAYIRQGDVYFVREAQSEPTPAGEGVKPWPYGKGRLVPKGGRGSDHVVAAEDAEHCRITSQTSVFARDPKISLHVMKDGLITIEHPEHPPVYLEGPGVWLVRPQRRVASVAGPSRASRSRVWMD